MDIGQESSPFVCIYVTYLPSSTEDIITIIYLPGGITKLIILQRLGQKLCPKTIFCAHFKLTLIPVRYTL